MVIKNPTEYDKGKTIVYFVRHGERIHIPGTLPPHDFSLNENGKKQAKNIAKEFSKIKGEIDVLYTSPMKRTYETAVEIGKEIGKKPKILLGFEEINKPSNYPAIFSKHYWKNKLAIKRKQNILDKVLEENQGKVLVIVGHGRLNRTLIGAKLGLSQKISNLFDAHNCHVTLIRFKGKKIDYIHCVNSKGIVPLKQHYS